MFAIRINITDTVLERCDFKNIYAVQVVNPRFNRRDSEVLDGVTCVGPKRSLSWKRSTGKVDERIKINRFRGEAIILVQRYLKKLVDEIITDEILSLILICSVDFDESIFSL